MSNVQAVAAVDVICDLRNYPAEGKDIGLVQAIWQQVGPQIIGREIANRSPIIVDLPQGQITLWIIETQGTTRIGDKTEFRIVDVLRNPQLVYRCRVCGEYGPLRCAQCESQHRPERLCSIHARLIKDELSAYCDDHIPLCQCRPGCSERAFFRCQRCHKLHGQHVHRPHPRDAETDYCLQCYQILFERCVVCEQSGVFTLGKSKCNYRTQNTFTSRPIGTSQPHTIEPIKSSTDSTRGFAGVLQRMFGRKPVEQIAEKPLSSDSMLSEDIPGDLALTVQTCGKPLCWNHSYQWKIWGPHNRGVTLCENHKKLLSNTPPIDLLFMMLTERAPFMRRGRRQSLPNPFRLRRIINFNRSSPLSFEQLGRELKSLESRVSSWGRQAENSYRYMNNTFSETVTNLVTAQVDLLHSIREFYKNNVGGEVAQKIVSIEITDRYYKPGQPPRYRVHLHLSTTEKGAYIGKSGATIRSLCSQLNIEVDL